MNIRTCLERPISSGLSTQGGSIATVIGKQESSQLKQRLPKIGFKVQSSSEMDEMILLHVRDSAVWKMI